MATLFALLFFIALIATVVFLVKPSFTKINNRAALPRKKIALYGFSVSLFLFAMIGVFAPKVEKTAVAEPLKSESQKTIDTKPIQDVKSQNSLIENVAKTEKSQAEIDKEADQYRERIKAQQQELTHEDRPHIETPRADYTSAVAKVDLSNDQAILKAVKKPVIESEKATNQNGEPMTIYYFSSDLSNGLEISLSREFVDVAWKYDDKNKVKSDSAFQDGQRITRALLGGHDGAKLYEGIGKGLKFESIYFDSGIEVKNARCGSSICRYEVVR